MSIAKRIYSLGAALMALTLILGAVALFSIRSIDNRLEVIAADSLPGTDRISRLATLAQRLAANIGMRLAFPEMRSALDSEIDECWRVFPEQLAAYEKTITTARDRELYEKIQSALGPFRRAIDKVRAASGAKREPHGQRKGGRLWRS